MTDEELLQALREATDAKFRPSFEIQRQRAVESALLTDEEYWEINSLSYSNEFLTAEQQEQLKRFALENRHDMLHSLTEEKLREIVESEALATLPFLQAIRFESGATGIVSHDEISEAGLRKSRAETEELRGQFEKLVAAMPESPRKDFATQFAANSKLDIEELQSLGPDSSEEEMKEITARLVARMAELTKKLKPGSD